MTGEFSFTDAIANPFVQTGVIAVLGALVTRVLLRSYPTHRLIFQSAFFVALTLLLYHHGIVPYEVAADSTPTFERFFVALAKIIWWVNGAWVLTGFTRVFLIFERRPREGRLIQDLVVGLDLSRCRAVGRRLRVQRAGRHPDRHLGRASPSSSASPCRARWPTSSPASPSISAAPIRSATGSC